MLRKIKSYFRNRKIKKQVTAGLRLIASANRLMVREGWPRQRRRAFWREFIARTDKNDAIAGFL